MASAAQSARIELFKTPDCECCQRWADRLEAAGLDLKIKNVSIVASAPEAHRIPLNLRSCHIATVDGYVLSGHVPISDIQRLLRERPELVGLAVPNMPPGSPGMESDSPVTFDVFAVHPAGNTSRFATHKPENARAPQALEPVEPAEPPSPLE